MTVFRRPHQGFTPRFFGKLRVNPELIGIRQTQGFTLIELMLVTLLILILAGLSTPLFKRTLSDLSARNVSFSICKLANYAQEMAVLESNNYKIAFDFQNGRYQLFELSSSIKPPAYKKAAGRFGKIFVLPQGLKLDGKEGEAVFYPDGHCDDININVSAGAGGYSITVKGFGNMPQVKPFGKS